MRRCAGFQVSYQYVTGGRATALQRRLTAIRYDLFHMQIMEGRLLKTIERLLPRIGHMQIAGAPDRHEPGTGELNCAFLLNEIDKLGYAGTTGCEYNPAAGTLASLGWADPYLKT